MNQRKMRYFGLIQQKFTHEVLWENTMCLDTTTKISEIRDLMAKAFKGPLPNAQQQLYLYSV